MSENSRPQNISDSSNGPENEVAGESDAGEGDAESSPAEQEYKHVETSEGQEVVVLPPDRTRRTRFGSVRVAWHRMTLGNNPGGTTSGPPVELGEKETSERFETVDGFSRKMHDGATASFRHKPVYRMSKIERRNIALAGHTEDEIADVEKEVLEIRQERKKSSKDPEEGSVKAIIAQNKAKKKQATKQKKGLFGRFRRS